MRQSGGNAIRAVSVPVQRFQKSFLFQLVENGKVDKTARVGGLGASSFSMPSRMVFTPSTEVRGTPSMFFAL
jgi:hypothetical protein